MSPSVAALVEPAGTVSGQGHRFDETEQQMAKQRADHRPISPSDAAEASRWCQRALVAGERAAREEYYQEERRKGRQDRRGYAWWRTNVHQRLKDYRPAPDRNSGR